MREIPLKIVPDEIALSPGTTTVQFGGMSVLLPNGNTLQVSAGSITFTWDPGPSVTAARVQELIARLDDPYGPGAQAHDVFGNAIGNGLQVAPGAITVTLA